MCGLRCIWNNDDPIPEFNPMKLNALAKDYFYSQIWNGLSYFSKPENIELFDQYVPKVKQAEELSRREGKTITVDMLCRYHERVSGKSTEVLLKQCAAAKAKQGPAPTDVHYC